MIAIAPALSANPPLVLADERAGNTKPAESVFELMRQVNKGPSTTFLLVTHNMQLDRLIEAVDGELKS